ncbi:MAG TPA: lipid-A-disaccharide synthase [Ignavibacteriaceae bacterium]|nr:lipid-A-disaccharide synthase [Ignavibacteriaceae bacterium]
MKNNVLIIAGEASGDMHGANLVREVKALAPGLNFYGLGGSKMKAEGVNILYPIDKLAFLGFVEVLKHLPFIKKVKREVLELVKEKNIQYSILIDYPGFNLNIAEKLHKVGVRNIYFISPQIWAWGKKRLKKIKTFISKMIVLFDFEYTLYKDADVDVEWIGHPLVDIISEYNFLSKEELFNKFNLDKEKEVLLILPGSRKNEIKKILPDCINGVKRVCSELNLQPVIACSDNIEEDMLKGFSQDLKVVKGFTYDLMKYSKFGVIKSGTSTLEAGLLNLPMIIVYKTSPLTYWISKKLIQLKSIGLVNIVAGEQIVPELIQDDVNDDNIYKNIKSLLIDESRYSSIKEKFVSLKHKLQNKGNASKEAAKIIVDFLNEAKRS